MYGFQERLLGALPRTCACFGLLLTLFATLVNAAQVDIHGPIGSVAFGNAVTVLPNGNIVVTDPNGPVSNIGAVYLYDANGNLISTLTGSSANDNVGSGGVTIVGNSNFVVVSPLCNIGAATRAGAVTWMNGSTGLGPNAVVSSSNSLVGSTANDRVGFASVTVLSNGNYVVRSPDWNKSTLAADSNFGAVTWGDGNIGISGPVSMSNSLIGSTQFDLVGYDVTALSNNGNYVVRSPFWTNNAGAANGSAGAATWGNGLGGTTGPVSTSNSLVGTSTSDEVGNNVIALNNGNYVVASPDWANNTNANAGAVTWADGSTGLAGVVSIGNSLVGTTAFDFVGSGGVTALSNGNCVVVSPEWNNGVGTEAGAVTWCNGLGGTTGSVSSSNSLIGTVSGDNVGSGGVIALGNGNYVVSSGQWNGGNQGTHIGAVTWSNASGTTTGPVLPGNSLIGTTSGDRIGSNRLIALSNGNYVVISATWNNGTPNNPVGAVTWVNGTSVNTGSVTTSNSLVGTTSGDYVGSGSITALTNGNYVVASPMWNNGVGAATWGNGSTGTTGPVLPSNSLVGTMSGDNIGNDGITALSNGNYAVNNPHWNNNVANSHFGAMTWGNGNSGISGPVSAGNSLIGTNTNDQVSSLGARPLSDGNYVVLSQTWNNGAFTAAGAVTLASSSFRLKGTIQAWNSVRGGVANGGNAMVGAVGLYPVHSYDATRHRLAVGRPAENIVTLFTMDQIFVGDFDP